jgi:hypothetical protein
MPDSCQPGQTSDDVTFVIGYPAGVKVVTATNKLERR